MTTKLVLILSLAITIPSAGDKPAKSSGKQKKEAVELIMPPTVPAPKVSADAQLLTEQLGTLVPLTRAKLLGLAPAALVAKTVLEPETYVLTPNRPVVGHGVLQFYAANVIPSPDSNGSANFLAGQSSFFVFSGPMRAGRGYLLDCMVAGASNYSVVGGGAPVRTVPAPVDGHLTFGLRQQDVDGSFSLTVAGDRNFALSRCEVVPVQ